MHSALPLGWIATATLFLSFQVPAQEPPARVENALQLPVIQPIPDQLPGQAAGKRAAVFSINRAFAGGEGSMNKGFFLDGSGLALCPLRYLCHDATLRFDASDGEILAAPKVRAVFPTQQLALVKFAYKPKAWLEIADERPPPGEWVALIGTLRDPVPPVGPVLAYRLDFKSNAYPETATTMSFATGRSPALSRIFAAGAPLMDRAGRAIGIFCSSEPLAAQTLRFATPLHGFAKTLRAALKTPLDLSLPIPPSYHSLPPARLDPLWGLVEQAAAAGDQSLALERVTALLRKYPGDRALPGMEWGIRSRARAAGTSDESPLESVRRTKPPDDAAPAEQAAYLHRLGSAHHSQADEVAAAMDAYRKALELAPEISHACAANLASIHAARGESEQAEIFYRNAVALVPERIDYLEGLQKVLEKRANGKLSTQLTDWIYQVEDLYRSR